MGQALGNLRCSVMLASHNRTRNVCEGAAYSNCVRICCRAEGRAHPRGASAAGRPKLGLTEAMPKPELARRSL
eukprot:845959-Pyramimonas_sp.AAC.1